MTLSIYFIVCFNETATTEIYTDGHTPSLHDALPISGVYRTPAIHVAVTGVFTNTVPVDAYRGAGRPEAIYVIERLVDAAARELGMDPAALRQRNFIPPDRKSTRLNSSH